MIRLNGSVEDDEDQQLKWHGSWRFAKERKAHSEFIYKRVSDSIPEELRDLYLFALGKQPLLPLGGVVAPPTPENAESTDGAPSQPMVVAAEPEPSFEDISLDVKIEGNPIPGVWEGHFKLKTKEGVKDVQELFFCMLPSDSSTNALGSCADHPPGEQPTDDVKNEADGAEEPLPPAPAPLTGACKMIGFGKNAFGRFSLVGEYSASARLLSCEKKYMYPPTHKHRRGPRPGLSRSSSAGAALDDAAAAAELHRMVTRTRTQTGQSGAYDDKHAKKRQRLIRSTSTGKIGTRLDESGDTDDDNRGGRPPMPSPSGMKDYVTAYYDEETGEVYEGGWVNGCRHGKGICLYADGYIYEGEWVQNREHGRGQLLTGDRQVVYSGEWCDGKMQGQGVYHFQGGDRYTGDWRESARHGRGEYVMKGGTRYDGEWRDNMRWGRGVFTWHDGSFYDGEWENDMRHGKGVLQLSTGFMYEGTWTTDNMEGKGVCVFPNGHTYRGMFKFGLRDGRGSYFFPEGAVYEGRFREDRIDGQGTVKIERAMAGGEEGETFIPLEIQSDIRRIHFRAGFDEQGN